MNSTDAKIVSAPASTEENVTWSRMSTPGSAAFVVCTEKLEAGDLVATNLFVQEAGGWKLAHHHAGPVASDVEDDEPRSGFLN